MTIENLLIDQVVRGTLLDKTTGEVIFSVDQIQDASLECTGETVYSTDKLGAKIAAFNRSKDATLSGSNAIINFGLMAAQLGSEKVAATAAQKIVVPMTEVIQVSGTPGAYTLELKKVPVGTENAEVKFVYLLDNGRNMTKTYSVGGTAVGTNFVVDAEAKKITLPSDATITADSRFIVWYDYEADGTDGNNAIEIKNKADAFARAGIFDLEVLFVDICDQDKKSYGHVIFGNAKMQDNVTITFSNEAEHGFTIECMQDYCTFDRDLFRVVVPDAITA